MVNLKAQIKILILIFLAYSSPANSNKYEKKHKDAIGIIYGKWKNYPLHNFLTQNKCASVIAGIWANSPASKIFIPSFIKKHSLDPNEFELPINSFKTFNDFFHRKLKPEARPISDQDNSVISPCDGNMMVITNLNEYTEFPVKGITFSLEKLLKNKTLAKTFKGGSAFIIRLTPWDYHRLHFPLNGIPAPTMVIHGKYESVHPIAYSSGIQPLEINERHLLIHETKNASTIALVTVGALFVGSITETYTPFTDHQKGDEFGYFSFGGSTVVLLFKADTINIENSILENSKKGLELPIKMGQQIATIK